MSKLMIYLRKNDLPKQSQRPDGHLFCILVIIISCIEKEVKIEKRQGCVLCKTLNQ